MITEQTLAELNAAVAERVMGIPLGPFAEHVWLLDQSGQVDDYAWEFLEGVHGGTTCGRCRYSRCTSTLCDPDHYPVGDDWHREHTENVPCVPIVPAYTTDPKAADALEAALLGMVRSISMNLYEGTVEVTVYQDNFPYFTPLPCIRESIADHDGNIAQARRVAMVRAALKVAELQGKGT